MQGKNCTGKRFTLIELLVVIAIIGILASMLLPVLSRARRTAKVITCVNTLHQSGLALTIYADEFDGFYPDLSNWPERWKIKNTSNTGGLIVADHRPFLRTVFGNLDHTLVCAVTGSPSLEGTASGDIYCSYAFYAGTYLNDIEDTRMQKQGQEITISGKPTTVMMGDHLRSGGSTNPIISSHDAAGLDTRIFTVTPRINSGWKGLTFWDLDRSFVFQDGHVETVRNIDGNAPTVTSNRFVKIRNRSYSGGSGGYEWIPFDE